jgi:predicted nucleotidyltransferase
VACRDRQAYDGFMRRADALKLIEAHRDELRTLGVCSLSIFGSVARDEARADSDIDLLAEFTEPIGYFHLFRVQHRLEEILGVRVDLTTPGGLRRELRDIVLAEAVRAA